MRQLIRSVYSNVLGALPDRPGKAILRAVWRGMGRPSIDAAPGGAGGPGPGSVTFSLDFELAWAWRYSRQLSHDAVALGLREREQFPRILAAFDSRRLPATWAAVGHLFLESCRRGPDGRAHPEIPAIAPFQTRWWKYEGPDWFAHDPCTDVTRDPAWYAPDLLGQLKESPTGHEIGCHSFSHLGLGPYCPHEAALADLQACRAVMDAAGLDVRTFVHPGNDYGNFAALREAGFTIFRMFPWSPGELSLPVLREDAPLAPGVTLRLRPDVFDCSSKAFSSSGVILRSSVVAETERAEVACALSRTRTR